ncbi:hypothetical protein [uncultured Croceitalea sp.]|uniref:hypothetical protein n=1 Tax=uncultured Croceitalea sp. TaxID=1798908 RepID=UPI003305DFC7
MFKNLKSYLDIGNDFYGIEIYDKDEVTFFQLTHLHKTKKELIIISESQVNTWEQLLELINRRIPVYLSINSKDVLDKLVSKKTNNNQEDLINNAFPSLDFDRFYFNATAFRNFHYLAIIEKIRVDDLLSKFKKEGIYVVNYFLGLSALSYSLNYLSNKTIHTNTNTLSFFDSSEQNEKLELNSEKIENQIYSVNGLSVKSISLLSFSGVLSKLLDSNTIHTNYSDSFLQLGNNFKYDRRFRVLLWPTIAAFLTILLVNFFVFNFYFDSLEQTNQDANANAISKNRLTNLKKMVDEKERKVGSILSNQNSSATFFVDDIAKSIPESILLVELNYQPLLKPVRNLKPIELDSGTILISGATSNSEAFSAWIEAIENLDWVDKVETTDYNFGTNASSNFTLKIITHE